MKTLIIPMIALLIGCPSPPETPVNNAVGNNQGPNNANNQGPNNANPGGDNPGGDNPGGDNPGGDNPGGDNPGGDNPGEAGNGGSENPGGPEADGDGTPSPGADAGAEGNNGEGSFQNSDPITDSILITVEKTAPADTSQPQESIKAGSFVTFSGTAKCGDCTESLVLRSYSFVVHGEEADAEHTVDTRVTLDAAGAFSIAVPKSDAPMVLELLVDANGDGLATVGERVAVLEMGGTLIADQNRSGIELDATTR